jgi:hypothetical protein
VLAAFATLTDTGTVSPAPAVRVAGVSVSPTGVTVMLAVALLLGSAELVAVTVYVPPAPGAVHEAADPFPVMVPAEAVQVTAVEVALVTVAVNSAAAPAFTVVDDGEMDTATWGGGVVGPPSPPPQATSAATSRSGRERDMARASGGGRKAAGCGDLVVTRRALAIRLMSSAAPLVPLHLPPGWWTFRPVRDH